MVSPSHKKRAVQHVAGLDWCSTRRACGVVNLAPSSYYHRPKGPTDRQQRLEQRISALSKKHPRWGYRFIHQLLCDEGWRVNRKRVQRVRRQEGLGVRPVVDENGVFADRAAIPYRRPIRGTSGRGILLWIGLLTVGR